VAVAWGITGSTGCAGDRYPVIHADSDLDLLIRAPQPISPDALTHGSRSLPCAVPGRYAGRNAQGGFALAEWLRDGKTLLKTARGPRLVADPWRREE
jgi:phosphoribosyl-dephospho-CoA transferase